MRVVLRELAHAHQAVKRTMRLVAVAAAHFRQPHRQVAIAFDTLTEDQHMRRAVHRLERHPLGLVAHHWTFILGVGHFVGDDEHVLTVFAPVARLFPLARVHDLRRLYLEIARDIQTAAHIRLEREVNHKALGMPEDAAVRLGLQMEQVHVRADAAVVALGGLLEPDQMFAQLLLVEPAGTIDPAEHRVVLVAAPIGTRNSRQLESLRVKLARRGQMRAPAHVHPGASAVDSNLVGVGQFGRPFGLERLAIGLPARNQVGAAPDFAHQRLIARDDRAHFGFDRGQVLLGERTILRCEVVVKAVIGRRPEGDLRAGEQMLHRLG